MTQSIRIKDCQFKLEGDMYTWRELMPGYVVEGERGGWECREDIAIDLTDFAMLDVDFFQDWIETAEPADVVAFLATKAADITSDCPVYLTAWLDGESVELSVEE